MSEFSLGLFRYDVRHLESCIRVSVDGPRHTCTFIYIHVSCVCLVLVSYIGSSERICSQDALAEMQQRLTILVDVDTTKYLPSGRTL